MDTLKGILILLGAIAGGSMACAAAPIVTVSSPLWGMLGTTYSVNGLALAGAGTCAAVGAGVGKIAGQTGGTLVIQGLDQASQILINKISQMGQANNNQNVN